MEQICAVGRDEQLVAETIHQASEQSRSRIKELEAEQKALERQLERDSNALRKLVTEHAQDGLATDRMADLRDRIRLVEQQATKTREELIVLGRELLDEKQAAHALAVFDPVWHTLSGRYDWDVMWPRGAKARTVIHAVREQLGLQMRPARRAIEMLVLEKGRAKG